MILIEFFYTFIHEVRNSIIHSSRSAIGSNLDGIVVNSKEQVYIVAVYCHLFIHG